jgi:AcrR family transcriptional regulator
MRTVDPDKHRARRTHIIESAVALFASKGFAETTTADICRAAGISTGSLFHYFPSKQAVFYGIWELDRTECGTRCSRRQRPIRIRGRP